MRPVHLCVVMVGEICPLVLEVLQDCDGLGRQKRRPTAKAHEHHEPKAEPAPGGEAQRSKVASNREEVDWMEMVGVNVVVVLEYLF